MIDSILALVFGYRHGKKEKNPKQKDQEYGFVNLYGKEYGYVREGESVRDLT